MRIIRRDGYNDACFQSAYFGFQASWWSLTSCWVGEYPNTHPSECFTWVLFQKDIIRPGKINMEPTKITPFRKEHDPNQTSMRTCSMSFFRGLTPNNPVQEISFPHPFVVVSMWSSHPVSFPERSAGDGSNILIATWPVLLSLWHPYSWANSPIFLIQFATCFWNQSQSSSNIMSKKQQQQQQQQQPPPPPPHCHITKDFPKLRHCQNSPQVAIKTSLDIFYFHVPFDLSAVLVENAALSRDDFTPIWQRVGEAGQNLGRNGKTTRGCLGRVVSNLLGFPFGTGLLYVIYIT